MQVLRKNRRTRPYVPLLGLIITVLMMLPPLFLGEIVHASTTEYIDVELRPDPAFSDVTIRQELGEDGISNVKTTIDIWQRDLVSEMPNGTFYGTLIQGSAFQHRFRPYWLPKDQYAITGRYSYVMLAAHFNFSSQIIMGGCSEWWMKIPILPSSVEWSFGIELAIWKDQTDLSKIGFDERIYYTNAPHIRASYEGYAPDNINGWYGPNHTDHYGDPLSMGRGDMHVVNSAVYVKIHSILVPDRDYIIAFFFRLPNHGSLKTLWTTAESPAGRSTRICFADYKITSNWATNHTYKYNMTGQEILDFDLDLDWSFIFTEGVGGGGLFGLKVPIENGTIITTYPFFNTTTDSGEDGKIHMSFMLPWISNETFNMSFGVRNIRDEGVGGGFEFPHWQFEPDLPDPPAYTFSWYSNMSWDYKDFALFSTNWTLDFDDVDNPFTDDDRWNVAVDWYFHTPGNLTLLCYDNDRDPIDWGDVGPFPNNTTKWPYARNVIWDGNDYHSVVMDFGVYTSAWGTHGQWAIRSQTATGRAIYTHYFPSRIYLSESEYTIRKGNQEANLTPSQQLWQEAMDKWGPFHYLKSIAMAITATIMTVWEGVDTLKGFLVDGLSRIWEAMKSMGHWLYVNLASFFEKVINFLEDIADLLIDVWDVAKYLVAPILLMAIYGGSIKVVRHWLSRKRDVN